MSNNSRKLRIGVVGLGRVATSTHIPVLNVLDGVDVTACAETNMDRVSRVKEFLNLRNIFSDYHEMYTSQLVDAVYICTPPHTHYDSTISAFQNGLHVLCEKPMGQSLEEAIKMNSLAQEKNLILMPGFKYRFNRNLQQAAQIIRNGLLGTVIQIEATFMTPGPYISWDPKSEWYLNPEHGGIIYDIGAHIVELVNMLVPDKITKIYAYATQGYYEYEIPTNVSCSFITESGITGTITFGWRSSLDVIKVSIYGTGGAIIVDLKSINYFNAGTDPKDRIFNYLRSAFLEGKTVLKRIASIVKGTEVSINDLEQAKAFVKAVHDKTPPPVSGENGVYIHRVLRGIEKSIKSNRPITL